MSKAEEKLNEITKEFAERIMNEVIPLVRDDILGDITNALMGLRGPAAPASEPREKKARKAPTKNGAKVTDEGVEVTPTSKDDPYRCKFTDKHGHRCKYKSKGPRFNFRCPLHVGK